VKITAPSPLFLLRVALSLLLLSALVLVHGCAAPKTSCTNGVCVATDPDGLDHIWPEPVPETPAAPAQKPDREVKGKGLPTVPPAAWPNTKRPRKDHRVEFHMQRVGTPPIEIEYTPQVNRRSGPVFIEEGKRDWRKVEWVRGPGMVMLWVTRVRVDGIADRDLIKCWITVDGEIPDNRNRPDGVPSFKADGQSTGLFDCYVSAWVPAPEGS